MAKKRRKNPAAEVVDRYQQMVHNAHQVASGELEVQNLAATHPDEVDTSDSYPTMWAWLRSARVFCIPAEIFWDLYELLLEAIVGPHYEHNDPDIGHLLQHKATELGYPDKLPFDFCYLGYTKPVDITDLKSSRMSASNPFTQRVTKLHLWGYLLTHHGFAYEFLDYTDTVWDPDLMIRVPRGGIATGQIRDPHNLVRYRRPDGSVGKGEWQNCLSMNPWIVWALLDLINDNRTLVLERKYDKNMRRKAAQSRKTLLLPGKTPPPYYLLRLQDKTIIEDVARKRSSTPKIQRDYTYRFDVRGHERVRIRRGPLPLDPGEERELLERGYKIYTDRQPDDVTQDRLLRRKLPQKSTGEWLAVLVSWVRDYQKGPEDAPYIPATRVQSPVGNVALIEEEV